MLPAEALGIWSECCAPIGVKWLLYGDTLLCAEGYGQFPETLKTAQIAVFSKEIPAIMERVIPALPEDWELDVHQFAVKKSALCLKNETGEMIRIHVLYPVKNADEAEKFSARVNQCRADTRTKQLLIRVIHKFFGRFCSNWLRSWRNRLDQKGFDALLAMLKSPEQEAACYCDYLTNKNGVILPREYLEEKTDLICEGISYPAFNGYREYLTQTYADYENGLWDEIGCGLTMEDKENLKIHQSHCVEALAFLQEISREFGLRYYLLAGSVLGCVRHGGFIPWDDDIDVGIRLEELPHFEEIVARELPKRLPEGFRLMQCGPNNDYPRMFSKICYDGRCCVDLWPLIPAWSGSLSTRLTWYFARIITKVHYKKLGKKPTRFVRLVNFMSRFMTDSMTLRLARWNERKCQNRETDAYVNLYSIYPRNKETIFRRWLDTRATAEFEGITVPIVGCTEEYLTHLYGDYMAFPPPWKRASRHVDRF